MGIVRRTLLESLVVLVVALGLSLLANGLNENGLSLSKNYFDVSLTAPVPAGPAVEDPASGESVLVKVSARLRQAGLQPITHDEAAEIFGDEKTEYEQYIFVDARSDQHYQSGHIPGAYQFDHVHLERYVT
ncbi:MAG: rhodanese-like domain-containing protein, partial [Planctomycetota bacterium]